MNFRNRPVEHPLVKRSLLDLVPMSDTTQVSDAQVEAVADSLAQTTIEPATAPVTTIEPAPEVVAELPAEYYDIYPTEIPAEVPVEEIPVEVYAEEPMAEVPVEVAPMTEAPVEVAPVETPVELAPVDVPVEVAPVDVPVETPVEVAPVEIPVDPVEVPLAPVDVPVDPVAPVVVELPPGALSCSVGVDNLRHEWKVRGVVYQDDQGHVGTFYVARDVATLRGLTQGQPHANVGVCGSNVPLSLQLEDGTVMTLPASYASCDVAEGVDQPDWQQCTMEDGSLQATRQTGNQNGAIAWFESV